MIYFISFCNVCSSCNSLGRVLDLWRTTLSSSMTFDGSLWSGSNVVLLFLSSVFFSVFGPLKPLGRLCGTSASVSSKQLKLRCFLARFRSLSSLCSKQWAMMEALSFKLESMKSRSCFSPSRSLSSSALAL